MKVIAYMYQLLLLFINFINLRGLEIYSEK